MACYSVWSYAVLFIHLYFGLSQCKPTPPPCREYEHDKLLAGSAKPSYSYPPVFRKRDEHQPYFSDQENVKITRKCQANGQPAPEITWYKKAGNTYEEITPTKRIKVKKSLTIQALKYSDEGDYRCVASNECGSIEWNFFQDVTVNEFGGMVPPKILIKPENITVYEHDEAELECTFYSLEPPSVYWYKITELNGTEIKEPVELNFDEPDTLRFSSANVTDSAVYECSVINKHGESFCRHRLTVMPLPPTPASSTSSEMPGRMKLLISILVVVPLVIFAVLLVLLCCLCRKQRKLRQQKNETIINPIYPFIPTMELNIPYDERFEFDRANLELGDVLGEGFFGQVIKGYAIGGMFGNAEPKIIAVKMLKPNATERDLGILIQEMNIMKSIGQHLNIVNFLGCCTQNGPLYMLVEYCANGNLRDFLRSQKKLPRHEGTMCSSGYEKPVSSPAECSIIPIAFKDLMSFSFQVAKGMQYLSSKKIIHRDLAARNVLVADDFVLKICDFGLTKELHDSDYYTRQTETPLPVKWMAVECLKGPIKFTSKSDVWSFGVLLWEIFSYGGNPYPFLDVLPHGRFCEWLEKENRMDRPQDCPHEMHSLMLKCWRTSPDERPSFDEIVLHVDSMVSQSSERKYLNLIDPALDYFHPYHSHDEEEDADEGRGSEGPNDDDYLDDNDNVFEDAHDRAASFHRSKSSRRSDSQYSSISSSQTNSGSQTQLREILARRSYHSQGSGDSTSLESAIMDSDDSSLMVHEFTGTASRLVDSSRKVQLSGWSSDSKILNDNKRKNSDGCHSDNDHSPRTSNSEDMSDEEQVDFPEKQALCSVIQTIAYNTDHTVLDYSLNNYAPAIALLKPGPVRKNPYIRSNDSVNYTTDEDQEFFKSKIPRKSYKVVYSDDTVECVESVDV